VVKSPKVDRKGGVRPRILAEIDPKSRLIGDMNLPPALWLACGRSRASRGQHLGSVEAFEVFGKCYLLDRRYFVLISDNFGILCA
jgi:hypothetical protein